MRQVAGTHASKRTKGGGVQQMKLIGYYNYTVLPTYAGLAAAVFGIFAALTGHVATAVLCLMLSGLVDMFDGKIAHTRRRSEQERLFGIQIDSLCDLVSFGVLPAVIGYAVGLRELWYIAVMVLYVLTALIRLAYFNVDEMDRQAQTTERRQYYQGLPVTTVALFFPVLYSLRDLIGSAFPVVYAVSLVLIAAAFVSPFRLKKPGLGGMLVMLAVGIVELVLLVISVCAD